MGDNLFRGENSGSRAHNAAAAMTGPAGIQAFQKFIETNCPAACVPVDLLKIARSVGIRRGPSAPGGGGGGGRQLGAGRMNMNMNHHQPHPHVHGHPGNMIGDYNNGPRLSLVLDGECCLDRLYGGFFSDWVCGGQWNRMLQFLAVLVQTVRGNNIEMTVFLNGGLETQRMAEWVAAQQAERRKVSQVLRHLDAKGTPPPKVWWSAPVCLRTCLRMVLRHLEVPVVVTTNDHRQEVIAFCRENNFHGLIGEDAVYAIFDPPRYFSAQQLKLTYKGSLETKEFILDEVAKKLDLHPNCFCVFAALLGNCLLTEADLVDFYAALPIENRAKATNDAYIRAVCAYVRTLSAIDNLDVIGAQIFGGNKGRPDPRIQKFKASVQYYLNGTKDGFLRYRPSNLGRKEPSHYVATWSAAQPQASQSDDELGKFASETQESELSSLSAYKEATCNHASDSPNMLNDPSHQNKIGEGLLPASNNKPANVPILNSPDKKDAAVVSRNGCVEGVVGVRNGCPKSAPQANRTVQVNGGVLMGSSTSSSSSSPAEMPTSTHSVPSNVPGAYPSLVGGSGGGCGGYPHQPQPSFYLPTVQPEVMKTASERHQKGLMAPWIVQVLTQGEFKLPVCLEEDVPSELPSSAHLYRPIRQMIYAILFNLHHLQYQVKQKQEMQSPGMSTADESVPDILVKEWVWTKYNQYRSPDLVRAEPLGWPVPTVQRLWFGNNMDDKKRRLRAFLTCMHSDTPLMLNTSYVPQHLLVMCCVLRYVLAQSSSEMRILRNHELSAFLAQAVSPRLIDAQYMQQVQLPIVSSRSVQLAALFMRGVETALFANDACGAPIPWLMCCPWLFFDGKLLHLKLHESNESKDLMDICEGQSEQVLKVERMRQAILKGLKVEFARRTLPDMSNHMGHHHQHHHMSMAQNQFLPAGAHWSSGGRSRGNAVAGRRAVIARGGQLEIAGVVVGSWGANFGTNNRGGARSGSGSGSIGRGSGSGVGGGGSGSGDTANNGNSNNNNNNNIIGGGRGSSSGGVAPQVTSVGGPRRGKPGYVKRYGTGNGGQNWFSGAPMGRGQPSYSIRRPPAVIRRPAAVVSVQTQGVRKTTNKKTGGAKGGGGVGGAKTSPNADAQSVRKVKPSGDKSSAKQLIKAGGSVKNGATEDQFEDATGVASSGEPKLPKSSPTIMKKPSVDEDKADAVAANASIIIPPAAADDSPDPAEPSDLSAAVITNNDIDVVIDATATTATNVVITVTVDDVVSSADSGVNISDLEPVVVEPTVTATAVAE